MWGMRHLCFSCTEEVLRAELHAQSYLHTLYLRMNQKQSEMVA